MEIRKGILILLLVMLVYFAGAQRISNVRANQEGQKIEINYDIENAGVNQLFKVYVYCSANGGYNYGGYLKNVTGDVGDGVSGGKNKRIVWSVIDERGELVGENVVFRIKAEILGNTKAVVKGSTLVDPRNDIKYPIVTLGNNIWMAKNLDFKTQEGCWCYDDNEVNCESNGFLYDWETATNVCPQGWHLPSSDEFEELLNYFSDRAKAYTELTKETSIGWNLKFYGLRNSLGFYLKNEAETRFWTSTSLGETNATAYVFERFGKLIYSNFLDKTQAFSVRCVKDKR